MTGATPDAELSRRRCAEVTRDGSRADLRSARKCTISCFRPGSIASVTGRSRDSGGRGW